MNLTVTLVIFLFPLAYSPGPGNMFFAALAARGGWSSTVPANIGYHIATWFVTAAIGLGFLAMGAVSSLLLNAVRWAGVAYVLFLAWRLAGARSGMIAAPLSTARVVDGALLLLLNPKAYVIIALMFSQFLRTPDVAAVFWITTVFTINNFIAFSLWAALGDRIARRLRENGKEQVLNLALAGMLTLVAVWMLWVDLV